jgi:hypothetical protein
MKQEMAVVCMLRRRHAENVYFYARVFSACIQHT